MEKLVLHLLVNQHAGSGKGARQYKEVQKQLIAKEIPFQTYLTEYAGHEREIVQELLKGVLTPYKDNKPFEHLLVVLGGDGTLHEVVNALKHEPTIPIGYLPSGSGNDFARGVGVSRKIDVALTQLLAVQKPKPISLMEATDVDSNDTRLILNNVGVGIDAKIVATANHSKAKSLLNQMKLGSLSYVSAALSSIFKQPSFPLIVETSTEKKEFKKAFLCTTTNHPYFGGGVAIDPTASAYTEDIHLIIVEKIFPLSLAWLIIKLFFKQHLTSPHLHRFVDSELTLTCPVAQVGQADGEELGERNFKLRFKTTQRLFWM
ncbi:diacylglycerol/lipid kinase family protein [Vagococcus bubulae]|uniref:DAGKc domain-containing protein n=1 Tax=Vagococcus bubulae TaxID=1977868 RepID=A0A429ZLL2_9ENTE|nr:diacylglycerol kinase family protein [Vagococcus bubulae]RST94594.1 hypothetical protein CBF36_05145 [Vagococcus bubulae]